jgi:hypothetical protein
MKFKNERTWGSDRMWVPNCASKQPSSARLLALMQPKLQIPLRSLIALQYSVRNDRPGRSSVNLSNHTVSMGNHQRRQNRWNGDNGSKDQNDSRTLGAVQPTRAEGVRAKAVLKSTKHAGWTGAMKIHHPAPCEMVSIHPSGTSTINHPRFYQKWLV